jgi:hypothetical protein
MLSRTQYNKCSHFGPSTFPTTNPTIAKLQVVSQTGELRPRRSFLPRYSVHDMRQVPSGL